MTETVAVRRVEIFTGAGQRRTWSEEAKRQIVAESYSGLETACAVARRHGLSPTQLFTWRGTFRTPAAQSTEPMFAPVVVESVKPEQAPPVAGRAARAEAALSWRSTAWWSGLARTPRPRPLRR